MTPVDDTGLFTHETRLDSGTVAVSGLGSVAMVGRGVDCALVLANDTVSRRHAKVTFRSAWVDVEDLDSSNGTRINGVEVEGTMLAPVGARVQFGRVERVVVLSADGTCATLTDPDPLTSGPAAPVPPTAAWATMP
jgi:pSer/pThr/pTyr-binding forkhead associated (FHA) protein